ncbi:MAG: glycosidase [Clostridia bacterium]|nr:glycosidase [Clostridia bacterium]
MALEPGRESLPAELFHRHPANPILTVQQWPYPANAVFNPAAARVGPETLLVVRVEDRRGFSHLTVARSRDGVDGWRIDPQPTLLPDPAHREERWGLEDPRLVWLDEERAWALTYVSFSGGGPVVSLALTTDFRHFERRGVLVPPEDKDAALLPRRVGGRWALIHRPVIRGEAHIWISFSEDLRYWGDHRLLLRARPGWWDSARVGLGAPPLETPHGWLLIYHGVRVTASGSLYRVGLALLDREEPTRVLRRGEEWVMSPLAPYERSGDVPGVIFPTGAVWEPAGDELRLYYGAGDDKVALATARMSEVLDYLLRSPAPEE